MTKNRKATPPLTHTLTASSPKHTNTLSSSLTLGLILMFEQSDINPEVCVWFSTAVWSWHSSSRFFYTTSLFHTHTHTGKQLTHIKAWVCLYKYRQSGSELIVVWIDAAGMECVMLTYSSRNTTHTQKGTRSPYAGNKVSNPSQDVTSVCVCVRVHKNKCHVWLVTRSYMWLKTHFNSLECFSQQITITSERNVQVPFLITQASCGLSKRLCGYGELANDESSLAAR